ncbi:MAG: DHH family phosphoesterase [Oligoflexales bacterium]|nr:DHH family phosphoesterase [Oligoflexales bacterium]
MGYRFKHWKPRASSKPNNYHDLTLQIQQNREFTAIDQLKYGDYGLTAAFNVLLKAIKNKKRIALYADYDVDGTMSCVSWIWFLQSIGYDNFTFYIPDRFVEGYGVNLNAVKHLVQNEKADLIITMDTGITANEEASWCKEVGVDFICTDHHKIQTDKMPDCIILNPKMHPDPLYQELCGCGITFVLLRKLGEVLNPPASVWTDILALTGMATICDVVPLNGVNHKLAQHGVAALLRSERSVLKKLIAASSIQNQSMDERDVGFRLGPRINAVGRLEHANKVIAAFIGGDPEPLIKHMGICNEKRKLIQKSIVEEAREMAKAYLDKPILFLGGDWHQGVVGIAASKIAEEFWRPVWLFQKKDDLCKGSARSIPNFDVTDAMAAASGLFGKFGGHSAAGGFSFDPVNEDAIRTALEAHAHKIKIERPQLWESSISYDFTIGDDLLDLPLTDHLEHLRPFGHQFEEPLFHLEAEIESTVFYNDKKTGMPRHTAVSIKHENSYKIMFFNEVYEELKGAKKAHFLVTAGRNFWRGQTSLSLIGSDFSVIH